MATITEREGAKGISFQVRYRIDNKQKTKTFYDKREAKTFAKKIEAQKTLGIAKDESHLLFKNYAKDFFQFHNEGLTKATVVSYKSNLNKISNIIGNKKLKDITAKNLDDMFLKLSKENKISSLKITLIVLNFVLNAAATDDLILFNPTQKMKFKFRKEINEENIMAGLESEDKKFLSKDKVEEAIEVANDICYPEVGFMIELMFTTGMRFGEVLAFKWSDIDYLGKSFIICRQLNLYNQIKPTKNKKPRYGYLGSYLIKILQRIKERQNEMKRLYGSNYNDNDLIICRDNGDYFNHKTARNNFDIKLKKTLPYKFTPHMLRHTFATILNRASKKDVQDLLGHGSEKVTDMYQHHNDYSNETKELIDTEFNLLM